MPEHPAPRFTHCPRCGADGFTQPEPTAYHCRQCDYFYHVNPAVGVGGLILDAAGRLLLLRRANEPGKGKLGLPGGFADAGESAEAALIREAHEEAGLEVREVEYLCSAPNVYPYRGVTYNVLDLFFIARTDSFAQATARAEVTEIVIQRPGEICLADIAFVSVRQAIELFIKRQR
jgi:ADP-ribose pyrophosphatase YjhB (NUDIX family)